MAATTSSVNSATALIGALGAPLAPAAANAAPGGGADLIAALAQPLGAPAVAAQDKARRAALRVQVDAWQLAHEMYIAPFPRTRPALQAGAAQGSPPMLTELTDYCPPVVSAALSPEALEQHQFGQRARRYVFLAYQLADGTLGQLLVDNPTPARIGRAIDQFLATVSENAKKLQAAQGLAGFRARALIAMEGDRERVSGLYKGVLRSALLPDVVRSEMSTEWLIASLKELVIGYCQEAAPSVLFMYEARLVANYVNKQALQAAFVAKGVEASRAAAVTTFVGDYYLMFALMFNTSSFSWEETLAILDEQGGVKVARHEEAMATDRLAFANSVAPLTAQNWNAASRLGMRDQSPGPCRCFYCYTQMQESEPSPQLPDPLHQLPQLPDPLQLPQLPPD
jgi:hypothetical protein